MQTTPAQRRSRSLTEFLGYPIHSTYRMELTNLQPTGDISKYIPRLLSGISKEVQHLELLSNHFEVPLGPEKEPIIINLEQSFLHYQFSHRMGCSLGCNPSLIVLSPLPSPSWGFCQSQSPSHSVLRPSIQLHKSLEYFRPDLTTNVEVAKILPEDNIPDIPKDATEIRVKAYNGSAFEFGFKCVEKGKDLTFSKDKKWVGCCAANKKLKGSETTSFDCCNEGEDITGCNAARGYGCCPSGSIYDGSTCVIIDKNPCAPCPADRILVNGHCIFTVSRLDRFWITANVCAFLERKSLLMVLAKQDNVQPIEFWSTAIAFYHVRLEKFWIMANVCAFPGTEKVCSWYLRSKTMSSRSNSGQRPLHFTMSGWTGSK